ncbi:hypothetical protein [Reinekea sp.]|jgi:hypothetical protein|uniref:hypothetical protein n=1 Tax=Reinekea sp. TaxID=1970455 RepID=UPI003988BAEC
MNKPPDLEIYIADINVEQSLEWLSQLFTQVTKTKKVKGMPKQAFPFNFEHENKRYEGIIYDRVADGFTSIWLNSHELPWQDDLTWGKVAAQTLSKEVRVTAGGWDQSQDADAWVSIAPDASITQIIWKT